MDKVFIQQLEIDTIIGIYEHERTKKQKVIFDLEMDFDISKAAKSENIDDALNYQSIADEIIAYVSPSQFLLIETLAEKVAEMVLSYQGVKALRLSLHKPNALPGKTNVGVKLERSNPIAD